MDSEPSEMSFSLSLDAGRLEWASHSLPTIFAQKRNLLSPSFWRMVLDVVRFGRPGTSGETPRPCHGTGSVLSDVTCIAELGACHKEKAA